MSKEEAVLCYNTSMAVFKKWFADSVITENDLLTVETMLAEKYGLSSCSIFRDKSFKTLDTSAKQR